MFKQQFLLIIIFLPLFSFTQNLSGIIYDESSRLAGIKVVNLTNGKTVYSGENGNFAIKAKINDSILFSSYNHELKSLNIESGHLNDIQVIVLKKRIHELQAVELTEKFIPKNIDIDEYNKNITQQLKEDMKRDPLKYGLTPDTNLDLIKAASLLIGLFKKSKEATQKYISFRSLDSLFKNHTLFNEKLLSKSLRIAPDQKNLFLFFCENQQINDELLKTENHFLLLDRLVEISKEYKKELTSGEKQ
ncbi:hypothetical protein MQE36_12085 [Zhouia spongiae]|uniref:Carboxypeptidase-like regulatory domain-containing protein n=1 Tax=Zhouia spongiae TaxID=2202721 RepID=A0ABY3YJP7_9FLAO|nr:hypothetical protein [Zhouia spongiae]UNY97824.1 hypothetical protein MQE36_12085 [Zhouia spongiae]